MELIASKPYLVDASYDRFSLEDPYEFSQYYTVSHTLLHIDNTEWQLFTKAAFNPLLGFSDVTKVFVCLQEMSLNIRPKTSRTRKR